MAPPRSSANGRSKCINYRNGGYRYENSDGSAHYNNGHGFEEFRHPDRSRNWKRYPNSALEPNMSGSGYDDDSESEVDRFVDGEGDIEMQDASYSIDEPDDDAPPPYSEYDSAPHTASNNPTPKARPLQTARRTMPKQSTSAPKKAKAVPKPTTKATGKALPASKAANEQAKSTSAKAQPTKKNTDATSARGKISKASQSRSPTKGVTKSPQKAPSVNRSTTAEDKSTPKAKAPARKKCSQCSVPGHDARNCPLNRFGLGKKGNAHSSYHEDFTTTTTTTTTTKSSKSAQGVISGRVDKKGKTKK
ncbi:MAG: nucleolar and coiled-body phosphoprotein 1 [Stictis urceolatum]|nr:nucleolar and coiled-body phosphoprotein 1 [Stictis urceolata]